MSWSSVTWTNGDTITEAKLDAMVANDDHAREEANYYPIVSCTIQAPWSGATSMSDLDVSTNSGLTAIFTSETASTDGDESIAADIDISGLTDGAQHVIEIDATFSDGGDTGQVKAKFEFHKTPDLEYLTAWYHYSEGSGAQGVAAVSITIIGHRETKGWT